MIARLRVIGEVIARRPLRFMLISLALTFAFYLGQLLALLLRFQNWPNYWVAYRWPQNIWHIVVSTPSLKDTWMIVQQEWLLEVGYMNYDFGLGISEWSLFIAPAKVLVFWAMSALVALFILLRTSVACRDDLSLMPRCLTGIGSSMVAVSSITLSWVVCCSTPTWVVGLAMLGLSVTTSLWLEPLGHWLHIGGFATLAMAVVWRAGLHLPNSSAIRIDSRLKLLTR